MAVLRVLAVIGGIALLVTLASSILRTLVIPRAQPSLLGHLIDAAVDEVFRMATHRFRDYEDRDRVLAAQGAAYLVAVLLVWLGGALVGFALLFWADQGGIGHAFREIASSMFTLGFETTRGGAPTALDVAAAFTGLIVVAVQIAYLPTLYGAFNRRETEVTLLEARAGNPPWGPELLARTRYGFRIAGDDLQAFYALWERWAADVAESHSNYPVLVRFRSPQPRSSWLVALVAVLDSAALQLAVQPSREIREARLCVRMGFTALRQIATAVRVPFDPDPSPDSPISLTFEEFRRGYEWVREVGVEVERTAEEAWPHFRGWRINYESIAYELCRRTDAVPALWTGSRRWPTPPMEPVRPVNRMPTGSPEDFSDAPPAPRTP